MAECESAVEDVLSGSELVETRANVSGLKTFKTFLKQK